MVILDTTIIIHLLRGDEKARSKIAELETRNTKMHTTQINIFEIIQGIYGYGKKPDDEIAALEVLLERVKVLDLNYFGAYHAGKISGSLIKKGITISPSDLLIAGIAIANNINIIATKNTKDFSKIPGIKVETY